MIGERAAADAVIDSNHCCKKIIETAAKRYGFY